MNKQSAFNELHNSRKWHKVPLCLRGGVTFLIIGFILIIAGGLIGIKGGLYLLRSAQHLHLNPIDSSKSTLVPVTTNIRQDINAILINHSPNKVDLQLLWPDYLNNPQLALKAGYKYPTSQEKTKEYCEDVQGTNGITNLSLASNEKYALNSNLYTTLCKDNICNSMNTSTLETVIYHDKNGNAATFFGPLNEIYPEKKTPEYKNYVTIDFLKIHGVTIQAQVFWVISRGRAPIYNYVGQMFNTLPNSIYSLNADNTMLCSNTYKDCIQLTGADAKAGGNSLTISIFSYSDIPNGSYKQSCTGIISDGFNLTASCKNSRGQGIQSSLNFNACASTDNIQNQDGYLSCTTWKGASWPRGQYRSKCVNFWWDGKLLRATCQGWSGAYRSELDFSHCPAQDQVIINTDDKGALMCSAWLQAPKGSYLNSCKDIKWDKYSFVLSGQCWVCTGSGCSGQAEIGPGYWQATSSLNYPLECAPSSTVANKNGSLSCDTPAP